MALSPTIAAAPPRGRHAGHLEEHSGRTRFVKRSVDRETARLLGREADVYPRLQSDCQSIHHLIPSVQRADGSAIVMEALPGLDLLRLYDQTGGLAPPVAEAVGHAVATVHDVCVGPALAAMPVAVTLPPDAHRVDPDRFRWLSGAGSDLARLLQRCTELCQQLEALRLGPPEDLIHADLRWENILVEEPVGAMRVRLVDWEFAGVGDASWDVGSFIASCLEVWLGSIPVVPTLPPDRLMRYASWPVVAMGDAVRAFWTAYAGRRGLHADAAHDLLLRSIKLAAARLVHLAFDATADVEDVACGPVLHLQVALNMLRSPDGARRDLFAIPAPAERWVAPW